ncbi:hypothetical protein CWE09_04425 [Aliidiomarina minuta]|uniref:Serine aminopeptidase S33 domain-containing protein n=1 Tax=Aliidiomarina minuta TaxID=880057 RepID=A0A432W7K2_9GAMM|nr:alpha/beta fold hydrolase [Aliidiomarina minuta]RUO25979.1 hypothetical protein CWE09_04425 [Aliidiomarina minuta]
MRLLNIIPVLLFSLFLSACSITVTEQMIVSPSTDIDGDNLTSLIHQSGYKPRELKSDTDELLYALEKEAPDSDTTLLVLHGNALNLSLQPWFGLMQSLAGLDINILAIDYRGFGYSEGEASFSAMQEDAHTALQAIDENQQIIIYGLSLGSVMALEGINDPRVKGVIIEGGVTTSDAMIEHFVSRNRLGSLASVQVDEKINFDNLAALSSSAKPALIIHGEEDQNIPLHMGQSLYQSSGSELSVFYPVSQGQHCDTFIRDVDNFLPRVSSFINSLQTQG